MSRRVFYVAYFSDGRIQNSFDAMRLIADPQEKSRAHITLRGPYSQRYNVSRLDRRIRGAEVAANGAGSFFREGQNTVFVRCWSDKLREAWKKRDFGFNPHITIYDGASREFAKELFERLDRLTLDFHFLVDGLSALVSHAGQYSTELHQSFDEVFAARVLGRPLDLSGIKLLSDGQRISLIESFASKLPDFARSPEAVTQTGSGPSHPGTGSTIADRQPI